MMDKTFVKNSRAHLELSQADLANVLGVTPGAVCRWEKGLRNVSRPVRMLLEQLVAAKAKRK